MTVKTIYSLTNICKKIEAMGYKNIIITIVGRTYHFMTEGKVICIFDEKDMSEKWT